MLCRENKLTRGKDFQNIFQKGRFFSYGSFSLKFLENGLSGSRAGVSVGLKFSKKAVERNRIRRQIRVVLRNLVKDIRPGVDLVIMVSGKKKKFDKGEVAFSLGHLFEKSRLI